MSKRIHPVNAVTLLTSLTIVAILVAVWALLWDLRKRDLDDVRVQTMDLTGMLVEQTEQVFDAADLTLRSVQERLQSGLGSQLQLDSEPVHLMLAARLSGMRQLTSMFLVGLDGVVINSSRDLPLKRINVTDRDYFKHFAGSSDRGLFVGKPERSRFDGSWTMHMARVVTALDGSWRGLVVAELSMAHFERLFSSMRLGFERPIALYTADGRLAASLPHRENVLGDHVPELGSEVLPLREREVRMHTHIGGDGMRQSFALGSVLNFPLLVAVSNEEDHTLAAWRETAVPIAFGATLISMFIGIVAFLLVRELVRENALARALQEADARYHGTIESVMDAIVAIDETQTIVMFNPAAERMFGLLAGDAIGRPLSCLVPERLRDAHRWYIGEFIQSEVRSRAMGPQIAITGRRADGSEFPIESTISQTLIGSKMQLTAVLRDVTERSRAEAEMRDMNEQLHELSVSLQNVREQERTRISRELHDELGQQLTGLKLELSWLSNRLREGREAPPEKVDAMRHALDETIASVRRISAELRPLILDDLGFAEAVTWQSGEFAKRCGLEIDLKLTAADRVTDDALATALFRIVQESLTNIARHAKATQVDIRLSADDTHLLLTVSDDGIGMDTARRSSGVGLASMRERATAMGGRVNIISSPGAGTTIEVRLVLPAAEATEEEI